MEKQKKSDSISDRYLPDSAIKKAITQVPVAKRTDTVGGISKKIKENIRKFKSIDYIYILDKDENLIGVTSIRTLFNSSRETQIEKVMKTKLITASPGTDQEKVADLAVKHGIKSVPIVKNKKFLGVITTDQILPILNRALTKDILNLAGIHKAHLKYENTLKTPFFAGVLHRLPWLLVGLVGITLAALFINIFETTLEKYIILAFFIPAIVYMSDALGTQHQTLFVRDLAVMGKELKIGIYFLRQMFISLLLAILIGGVMFSVVSLFWQQPSMAFVIATAIFFTLMITSFTALFTTLIISKLKLDPALSSGPLATIISDMTSIIVYFLVASVLLGGL